MYRSVANGEAYETSNCGGTVTAGEDKEMIAFDDRLNSNQEPLDYLTAIARSALQAYGLQAAEIETLSQGQHPAFSVRVPEQATLAIHPYLGRLAGMQFTLRLHGGCECRAEAIRSELERLAALLRDTELSLPEPVPSLDGVLIPRLTGGANSSAWRCVLVRWTSARAPGDVPHASPVAGRPSARGRR